MPSESNSSAQNIMDTCQADDYSEGQEVSLIIKSLTVLGFKAIVNGQHWGVLYHNEVFQNLEKDQVVKGYIKQIRSDGKIDLALYKTGHQGAEGVREKILQLLQQNQGFFALTDKSSPEKIYSHFGVSKKKFKIALSGLYKERLVQLSENGIQLLKK